MIWSSFISPCSDFHRFLSRRVCTTSIVLSSFRFLYFSITTKRHRHLGIFNFINDQFPPICKRNSLVNKKKQQWYLPDRNISGWNNNENTFFSLSKKRKNSLFLGLFSRIQNSSKKRLSQPVSQIQVEWTIVVLNNNKFCCSL